MLDSKIPDREVARYLALFIRDRINKIVFGADSSVPLDTSTTARVLIQVCTMLVESTHYIIHNNHTFNNVMTTKVSMMRDDKARFGKVASFLWSQGGRDQLHLGQGLSEPLHTIQFCLYKLCRVGKEARNLFTGEILPIYNLVGSPRVMAHIQFHALKDHQCSGTVPAPARFPARCSTGMPAFPVLIVPCSGPSLCGKRRCIILIRFPSRETGSSRASS